MTKHRRILSWLGILVALALAGPGLAQTSISSSASGNAQSSATLDKTRLQEQAAKVSADSRAQAGAKLAALAKKIDVTGSASASGDATVTTRISKEFGVSAAALANQRQQFGVGWGQILIAHTLEASAKNEVSADQILDLRQEGMGWGEIAAGLGLSLGKTVSAVSAESRVALGQARADGQVQRIQGAGVQASAASATEAHLPATDASVHAGLGLGLGHR